jgi:hypothetical protein
VLYLLCPKEKAACQRDASHRSCIEAAFKQPRRGTAKFYNLQNKKTANTLSQPAGGSGRGTMAEDSQNKRKRRN